MPVGSMAQARADELRAWSAMAAGSALPLRSFPAIVTSSTEVAEHALRQGFPYSSLRPCRQQPFYATSRFVRLRAFGLHVAASRGYRTWTPEPPEQVFGMVMHLGEGSATRLRLGQTERGVDAGCAALFRAQALATDYADDIARLVLRIPGSLLSGRLGVLLGRSDVPVPVLDQSIDLTGEPGAGLLRLIRFTLDEIDRNPDLMKSPVVLASWEDLVLTTLLTRLPHSASHLLAGGPDAAPWQVRRAEAWLEAHAAEPVTMEDLAIGVGVPLRTLQHTFRRARGYTPRDFLRQCRLDLAHRRLCAAPPDATVTAIALECGFGHFGDFARDYKQRFGESPSTTLRRR